MKKKSKLLHFFYFYKIYLSRTSFLFIYFFKLANQVWKQLFLLLYLFLLLFIYYFFLNFQILLF